jgi:hypothetical protein
MEKSKQIKTFEVIRKIFEVSLIWLVLGIRGIL